MNSGTVVILACRTNRGRRRDINTRRYPTWHLVVNESLEIRGITVWIKGARNTRHGVIHTVNQGGSTMWTKFLNQTSSVHMSSRECAGKVNLGKAPVLPQPLMLAQCPGIRPFGGVPLKALPQEVVEERRNRFWNGKFAFGEA